MNRGPILQRLCCFRRRRRREWCALHDLVAVQSFKAHQFDVIAKWPRTSRPTGTAAAHHHIGRRGRRLLSTPYGCAQEQRRTQAYTGPTLPIHRLFSSSLLSLASSVGTEKPSAILNLCASPLFHAFAADLLIRWPLTANLSSAHHNEAAPRIVHSGRRTACGWPSWPTNKSTWIHSLARSSFTGSPSAPSAPRCRRTRTTAASPVSCGMLPGSSVKSSASFAAISVAAPAGSL